ncbi:Swi5-domain-containing protein [Calycina marina]|uniref:Swi5-domain-containing protein n=1 Tax=Calycina marina TaxID=1763456 RepID=A0A9P8CCY3_9HELO|nr:Swi5-domain-containing protein [Calycina marina]
MASQEARVEESSTPAAPTPSQSGALCSKLPDEASVPAQESLEPQIITVESVIKHPATSENQSQSQVHEIAAFSSAETETPAEVRSTRKTDDGNEFKLPSLPSTSGIGTDGSIMKTARSIILDSNDISELSGDEETPAIVTDTASNNYASEISQTINDGEIEEASILSLETPTSSSPHNSMQQNSEPVPALQQPVVVDSETTTSIVDRVVTELSEAGETHPVSASEGVETEAELQSSDSHSASEQAHVTALYAPSFQDAVSTPHAADLQPDERISIDVLHDYSQQSCPANESKALGVSEQSDQLSESTPTNMDANEHIPVDATEEKSQHLGSDSEVNEADARAIDVKEVSITTDDMIGASLSDDTPVIQIDVPLPEVFVQEIPDSDDMLDKILLEKLPESVNGSQATKGDHSSSVADVGQEKAVVVEEPISSQMKSNKENDQTIAEPLLAQHAEEIAGTLLNNSIALPPMSAGSESKSGPSTSTDPEAVMEVDDTLAPVPDTSEKEGILSSDSTLSASQDVIMDGTEKRSTIQPTPEKENVAIGKRKPSTSFSAPEASQSKDVLMQELKAMKIASITARNTALEAEIAEKRAKLEAVTKDLKHPAGDTVKRHIKLLHDYNDTRDVGQGLIGMIADNRGVRIGDLYDEFGVGLKD